MTSRETTATLTAPDISCAHCVATVQQTVSALDGITAVKANADTKNVVVTFDPERATEQKIREALDEAGYPATP